MPYHCANLSQQAQEGQEEVRASGLFGNLGQSNLVS